MQKPECQHAVDQMRSLANLDEIQPVLEKNNQTRTSVNTISCGLMIAIKGDEYGCRLAIVLQV